MKRLLTFALSITLLLGSMGEVPVYAASAEDQPEGIEQEEQFSSSVQDALMTEDTDSFEAPEATEDDEMVEESETSDEFFLSEEAEEADEEEQDKLSGIDGNTLSGTVEAADLADNNTYTLAGDTTIHIADHVNKTITMLRDYDVTESHDLIITGDSDNTGTLTVINPLSHNMDKEGSAKLIINGGRFVCSEIIEGGDIEINGGAVETGHIEARKGTVSISGGVVKVHDPDDNSSESAIRGKNVTISGGNVEILNENVGAGIFAENNLSISGGVVNVRSIKEPDTYYYEKGCGLFSKGTLQISGTAVVLAEGF
ncbi:MAG: hypothetical protein K6D90_00290, partial [Lachnospiraceae bacterium]|nr:hypothetical protein [Lachnospiraceae bacterium]